VLPPATIGLNSVFISNFHYLNQIYNYKIIYPSDTSMGFVKTWEFFPYVMRWVLFQNNPSSVTPFFSMQAYFECFFYYFWMNAFDNTNQTNINSNSNNINLRLHRWIILKQTVQNFNLTLKNRTMYYLYDLLCQIGQDSTPP